MDSTIERHQSKRRIGRVLVRSAGTAAACSAAQQLKSWSGFEKLLEPVIPTSSPLFAALFPQNSNPCPSQIVYVDFCLLRISRDDRGGARRLVVAVGKHCLLSRPLTFRLFGVPAQSQARRSCVQANLRQRRPPKAEPLPRSFARQASTLLLLCTFHVRLDRAALRESSGDGAEARWWWWRRVKCGRRSRLPLPSTLRRNRPKRRLESVAGNFPASPATCTRPLASISQTTMYYY